MGKISPTPSRRALLGAFAATSLAVAVIHTTTDALSEEFAAWGDEPIILRRTEEGRSNSEFRYHNAEAFFASIEAGFHRGGRDLFYQAGIVMQLGLSSHLLDVGFDDQWCARHVGHRVAKSLAYANATGFEYRDPEIERLAAILTPYWKWNHMHRYDRPVPDNGGFTAGQIAALLLGLLDHVRRVTGHPRPTARETRDA